MDELIARERIQDLLRSARSQVDRAMDLEREATRPTRLPLAEMRLGKPFTWVRGFR